ncbi:MAG: ChbG/HpnK family deacetylase [Kiritimatiellia bacterium]
MPKLIVNADDFGFSAHTLEWTIRGFECGALSSATVMAGAMETVAAVAWAKEHPQFSFGVHFIFSDETPCERPEKIPSLIDPATGKLWQTRQFILRSFSRRIRLAELKAELRAQYLQLQQLGLPISHVDGHGHLHRLPLSLRALSELARELDFGRIRRTQDLWMGGGTSLPMKLLNRAMQRRIERQFVCADHFLMTAGKIGIEASGWFAEALKKLPEGVTEIGIHPGIDEEWRQLDTEGPFATQRPKEVALITYNDLPKGI